MEILNPRRILILGLPNSGTLALLSALTGSAPEAIDNSTAGLTHIWSVKTTYYAASIPIWLDELPTSLATPSSPENGAEEGGEGKGEEEEAAAEAATETLDSVASAQTWKTPFLAPEAQEVISAVGGWVFCFRRPVSTAQLEGVKAGLAAVQEVIETGLGAGRFDGVCLAVAMPQQTTPYLEVEADEWEDVCREFGFEFVDSEARGRNEFGERQGLERVREALEANEWEGEGGGDEGSEDGEWEGSFAAEEAELNFELFGVKDAVRRDEEGGEEGGEEGVEELERMLSKLKAVKEKTAGMPEEERKKYAAKAVNDLVRGLDVR